MNLRLANYTLSHFLVQLADDVKMQVTDDETSLVFLTCQDENEKQLIKEYLCRYCEKDEQLNCVLVDDKKIVGKYDALKAIPPNLLLITELDDFANESFQTEWKEQRQTVLNDNMSVIILVLPEYVALLNNRNNSSNGEEYQIAARGLTPEAYTTFIDYLSTSEKQVPNINNSDVVDMVYKTTHGYPLQTEVLLAEVMALGNQLNVSTEDLALIHAAMENISTQTNKIELFNSSVPKTTAIKFNDYQSLIWDLLSKPLIAKILKNAKSKSSIYSQLSKLINALILLCSFHANLDHYEKICKINEMLISGSLENVLGHLMQLSKQMRIVH